jgi:LmbE family N-acetylglucosaminyl deacetylase
MKLSTIYRAALNRTVGLRGRLFQQTHKRDFAMRAGPFSFSPGETILIVAPHADDELIGCDGFMRQFRADVPVFVFLCAMTGGDTSPENRRRRAEEFKNYCSRVGVSFRVSGTDIQRDLKTCIEEIRPSRIFVTSLIDPHGEHRQANRFLYEALRHTDCRPSVCWYGVSLPVYPAFVNQVVPLTGEEQERKWSGFRQAYPSQAHLHVKRFRLEEKIAGSCVHSHAAECFVAMDYASWERILWSWSDENDRCLDEIKSRNLEGSFSKVYRVSKTLYARYF